MFFQVGANQGQGANNCIEWFLAKQLPLLDSLATTKS